MQCRIVVLPLGSRTMNSPSLYNAIEQASSHGIAVIVSAGNEGPSRGYFISLPSILVLFFRPATTPQCSVSAPPDTATFP